jgi:hypothetical protein
MIIEMLFNNDIQKQIVEMILHLKNELNVTMYIIDFFIIKL